MFADNNIIIIPKSYGDLQTTRHPFCNDVTARPTGCFREQERGKKDLTSQGVSFGARVRHVDSISFAEQPVRIEEGVREGSENRTVWSPNPKQTKTF